MTPPADGSIRGSGSMDDLSDNLQQIVRLLGQMTDVFMSDAVIEDMAETSSPSS